jgi:hypothetical protein
VTGRSEPQQLTEVLWADGEIQTVAADYSEVRIALRESTGQTRTVRCRGHIGYSATGLWDEVIVERAEIVDSDPFLDECLQSLSARYGTNPPETGCVERNQRSWQVLRIQLADGAVVKVAAADFTSD